MSQEEPVNPTAMLAEHRYKPDHHLGRFYTACHCDWTSGILNSGKTAEEMHAEHQLAALKAAGFEITKRTELGVTKGLPGLGDDLTRMTQRMSAFAGQEAGKNFAGALENLAPGASDATKAPLELASQPNAPQWVKQLLGLHDPLAAALDLIGRRTDIVAVKLPEPDYTHRGQTVWKVGDEIAVILDEHGDVTTYFQDFWDDDDHRPAPGALRIGAAVMLAAAARQELVIGDDAAEGEAK